MTEVIDGGLQIRRSDQLQQSRVVIFLNAENGEVEIGGEGKHGKLVLRDQDQREMISIDGETGNILPRGDLILKDRQDVMRLRLNGESGDIQILDTKGKKQIHLNGNNGEITAKGLNSTGNLELKQPTGETTILLDSLDGNAQFNGKLLIGNPRNPDPNFKLEVDGVTRTTDLVVDSTMTVTSLTIEALTKTADLQVSGSVKDGLNVEGVTKTTDLQVLGSVKDDLNVEGTTTTASLQVSGSVKDDLSVERLTRTTDLQVSGSVKGDLNVAGNLSAEDIIIRDANGVPTIELLGEEGDIRLLKAADCAEDFDVTTIQETEPGTVVTLNEEGKLCPCTKIYDSKVVGVVSGGGGYRPGLILDRAPDSTNRQPIALIGKVYCKVDADQASIEVGDLLTTCSTPGHAMKAKDPLRSIGAIIGKALQPFAEGKGLIPVLVTLQ